jgi:lipopolysaccharide export system protein LptC
MAEAVRRVGAAVNSVQIPTYQAGMDVRFAAAARHSRLVRALRVAVPAAVVLSMAMIVGVSIFNPFRMIMAKLPLDMGNLVVSGTKITMETPHLAGFSPDGRPYELWAKTATQDLTDPDNVELGTLRAKVMMEDKSTMTMDARTGLFNSKTQLLNLYKDIFLQTTSGYEARMTQAVIDIANGTVTSEEPVDVKLLNGTLVGKRLRITEHGELVRFEGGVVMNLVMDPPNPDAAAEPAPEPETPPPEPAKAKASNGKRANAK